jgi:GT2 family glycosyltransferase
MDRTRYKKDHVDIITLNYNGKDILPLLFDSLRKIEYKNHSIHMVDNGSSDGSADFVEEKYPEVNVIRSDKNLFFSRGNNLAIVQTDGEFILLINNDIVVTPEFLGFMVKQMKSDNQIAAVASKMLLHQYKNFIDAAGVVILDNGSPFNRGIGQPDIGQYDDVEQIFGACFGCVLIRRSYYENEIGQLDNMYYGYFEDVDWSYRTNLLGYKIIYEPKAVVLHAHSVTSRKNLPQWKHYLIQRNFIWTAQKNYSAWMAFKITFVRYRNLIQEGIKKRSIGWLLTNLKIIGITLLFLPIILYKRFKLQFRRKVSDEVIARFAIGEAAFFDPDNYSPLYTLDNLEYSFKRRAMQDSSFEKIFKTISKLNNEKNELEEFDEWDMEVSQLLNDLEKYIEKDEIKNFRNHILKEKTWLK